MSRAAERRQCGGRAKRACAGRPAGLPGHWLLARHWFLPPLPGTRRAWPAPSCGCAARCREGHRETRERATRVRQQRANLHPARLMLQLQLSCLPARCMPATAVSESRVQAAAQIQLGASSCRQARPDERAAPPIARTAARRCGSAGSPQCSFRCPPASAAAPAGARPSPAPRRGAPRLQGCGRQRRRVGQLHARTAGGAGRVQSDAGSLQRAPGALTGRILDHEVIGEVLHAAHGAGGEGVVLVCLPAAAILPRACMAAAQATRCAGRGWGGGLPQRARARSCHFERDVGPAAARRCCET